jgi:hypothetical protein
MFDTIAANVILHSKTKQLCSAESMELRSQRFIRLKLPKQKRAPAPSVQFHALETLSLSGCSVDLAVLLPRYPRLGLIRFDVTPFLNMASKLPNHLSSKGTIPRIGAISLTLCRGGRNASRSAMYFSHTTSTSRASTAPSRWS